ncbi:MAG: hypothetical protein ACE5I5_12565 [Candidatus Heimdallarchaeota archaeon]
MTKIPVLFEDAISYADLFELTEVTIKEILGIHRPGIMLGLVEMGVNRNQFIGGFHIVGTNEIYLNKTALRMIENEHPDLYKPYVLYLLIHEYIHSLGFGENETRRLVTSVCLKAFGKEHIVTKMAIDGLSFFFPYRFSHPEMYNPPNERKYGRVEFIQTRRKSDMTYV